MTRIRQFANDMGISYNEAKGLINKGKKRRDGGSTVLESYMPIKIVAKEKEPKKRIFFKKGDPFKVSRKIVEDKKKNKVPMPKPRPKNLKKKDPFRADKTESLNKKFSEETAKANEKAIKQIKKAMGGLKDIPPENKGLPKLPKEVRNKMGFKKKGGTIGNSVKMRLGGVARGGGAAISGTRFKGVY